MTVSYYHSLEIYLQMVLVKYLKLWKIEYTNS